MSSKYITLLLFILFYVFRQTTAIAQLEINISTDGQKFFGSANSGFQWGANFGLGIGWRNQIFLQADYATYLPKHFNITEQIIAKNKHLQPSTLEINSDISASFHSYGLSLKFIWVQPTPVKRNQFYLLSGVIYALYPYQINQRGSYDHHLYEPVLSEKDIFTSWMVHVGAGYEWLVSKNIGIFGEFRGLYPLTRRSYQYFEDIEITSMVRLSIGIRLRLLKGKAEI